MVNAENKNFMFLVVSVLIVKPLTIPGYSYSTKLKLAFAVANASIYDSMHFENFYDINLNLFHD